MNESTNESVNNPSDLGDKLWDEIAKTIADHMPNQLFPLFKEAFGKEYPKGTSIQFLQTEYPIPDKETGQRLTSVYSDITLLVNGSDLYHLECQMDNDKYMVVRMIEYDFHLALRHGVQMEAPNVFTLFFPHSTILYPDTNSNIPDYLICRVIFPDGSIHQYQVPAMKIQSYSLDDIRKKHLTMFLPFKLLSFRPRLKSVTNPIRKNELTEYINELIVILREEENLGNITNSERKDYLSMINLAAERVFHEQKHLKEEVLKVTKSVLVLPSDLQRLEKELADKNAELADKDNALSEQYFEIETLRKQNEALRAELASYK